MIFGNEIYLCRNGLNNDNFIRGQDRYYHFILLAKDAEGHKQLRELSTRAYIKSYMARGMRRVPTYYQDLFDIIGKNPGHVVGSTACLGGSLATQLLKYRETKDEVLFDKICFWIEKISDLFGKDNFYFEMQPSNNPEQTYVNKQLLSLSEKFNIGCIITTDTHYLKKEDREIHKAYLNAQNGDREVDAFYATTYLMNNDEIYKYFDYLTEEQLQSCFKNIIKIKDSCEDFTLIKPLRIPELPWMIIENYQLEYEKWFKIIPSLKHFYESPHYADNCFVNYIIDGIKKHSDVQNKKSYEEINTCLESTWISSEVNQARWSAYFLNLQNIIEECWNAGTIIGPSRGSGGGFILLYILGIIQMNNLVETTPCFHWRFLNPERASVLDIDTDIEGGRRNKVIKHLKKVFGEDKVTNVATFRTEKSKSAILTACRGLGIDVDIAQYLASLIPADRGQLRSLSQCYYGDEDKGFAPIKQFVFEMKDNYPEVWTVAQKIEGLVCGLGVHAGGIIFVDEDFTESTALMRAPDGTMCTQFDLHDAEDESLIKIDLLSVEALDKIHNCIDLLCDYGYIERRPTLRETYESVIGLYNLEREDPEMWKMVWDHKITSLFQMEKQSGINGIAAIHPKSVNELAVLNSVIRLMAPEKGAEQPLDMWVRYRKNIQDWKKEMIEYGLNQENINWLMNHSAISDGVCESQEGLMSLLQEKKLGDNGLSFADKCRKAIAKKQGKLFEECEQEYFENAKAKNCDMILVHYVWDVLLRVQRGYSFCRAHTLAYSLIALQEMNLAFKYPLIFWNCACLINDAGGNDDEDSEDDDEEDIMLNCQEEEYYNELPDFNEEEDEIEESYDEEDCDGYESEIVVLPDGKKKKKKTKTVNYGKIATAIGKMQSEGIVISCPDINKSSFTFSPDVEQNMIRYGLKGITRISTDLIKTITANRPYTSLNDFLTKVKITKPQVINLIKCGAFNEFGTREEIMTQYLNMISDQKKTLNLRNVNMLIEHKLIPQDKYDLQIRVFNFNKYLKKLKVDNWFLLNNVAFSFYEQYFDLYYLVECPEAESGFKIEATKWKKYCYDKHMDILRTFIKENLNQLLTNLNKQLFDEVKNKYAAGTIEKWEMDSVSCYFTKHELANVNDRLNGFADYFKLPTQPVVDRVINIKGKQVPMFEIQRIAGTVLDRDKNKKTVTLLTKTGVVTVKIYGQVFAIYDKQISQKLPNGKKKVIEKSAFSRGNKIVVCGVRIGDEFLGKKYKNTPHHLVEIITDITDAGLVLTRERIEE